MVDLDELRESVKKSPDTSTCDPCQTVHELRQIKVPASLEAVMTPHERRLERARLALGDATPRLVGCTNQPLRICMIDDLGRAQFVDPRIAIDRNGLRLKHDSHLGAVSGDC